MTYKPGRSCAACGQGSPRSEVCGTCEVAARIHDQLSAAIARAEAAERERDAALAALARVSGLPKAWRYYESIRNPDSQHGDLPECARNLEDELTPKASGS